HKSQSARTLPSPGTTDESKACDKKAAPPPTLREAKRALARLRPAEPYIVIDRYANKLYLRTADKVLLTADCSTGSGAELVDSTGARYWKFDTPRGVFTVHSKLENPWWRKPDWFFIEENQPTPKDERQRLDSDMLGDYAIGFGDGYYIHGTIYMRLLGVSVTHGCVRLAAADLRELYYQTRIGTPIFIY
ncbi:MAG: L,D-transpeptidase, partial [Candidatus Zixiibacteriota bacterium]